MLGQYLSENNYEECIKSAIYNLKIDNLDKAMHYLHDALCQNDSSGEVHNLLGILYEKKGDLNLAAKHYRASSDLDPTLQASNINLERVTSYKYMYIEENIDYGEFKAIYKPCYKIVYDSLNIGRLKKNQK